MLEYIRLNGEEDMATESAEEHGESHTSDEMETDLEENVAAALTYVLGFVSGIIMYFVESENTTVRFHAVQSIVVFGGLFVLTMVLGFFNIFISAAGSAGGTGISVVFGLISGLVGLVTLLVRLAMLVLWIYLIVRTYQEENPRLPVAAGIADGYV
ncbi:MAG: putative membrane protein [Halobacteriales archaeon]|jgi:uncharacterized membrane protein